MKKMSVKILLVIIVFLVGCGGGTNESIYTDILYSNNFDTNSSPTYSITFGSPQIVGPIGQFTTNSLEFNSTGNFTQFYYDQIRYQIDATDSPYADLGKSSFHVNFDIITNELIGSSNEFHVLFDTPTVRDLLFTSEGAISINNPATGDSRVIANYADYEKMHVDIYFDINNNLWEVYINNMYVYGDVINGVSLRSIRFSHGAKLVGEADFNATTYIDNVLISAVPL